MMKKEIKNDQNVKTGDEARVLARKCAKLWKRKKKLAKDDKRISDQEILELVEASHEAGLVHSHRILRAQIVAASLIYRHFYHSNGPLSKSLRTCFKEHGLAPKVPMEKLHLQIARLCIKGRQAKDYSKYGAVLRTAHKVKLTPTELFRILNEKGGMSEFIIASEGVQKRGRISKRANAANRRRQS